MATYTINLTDAVVTVGPQRMPVTFMYDPTIREQYPMLADYRPDNLCRWCQADYHVDGRCQRCGQPESPCNEVAGRPFRMTWDRRSDWGYGWTADETDDFPRMPSTRNVVALRQMAYFDGVVRMAISMGVDVEAVTSALQHARRGIVELEEAMASTRIVPWTDMPIEGLRLT